MSWEHYRIFGMVAELRSIRKASVALSVSHTTVLKSISALECMIDAPLFVRNHNGMALTDFGRLLYDRYEAMKRLHDQTESEFSDLVSIHKTLRVVTTTGLAGSWMSQILPGFALEYPSTNVNIIGYDDDFDKKLFACKEYIEENGLINSEKEMNDHKFISYGEEKYRPYRNIDWYIKNPKSLPISFLTILMVRCFMAERFNSQRV